MQPPFRPYTSLKVWAASHHLALEIRRATQGFPLADRYGLTAQLRCGSLSIATNLVEGHSAWGSREFLRYARIAYGSTGETDYLLRFARDAGCLPAEEYDRLVALLDDVRRMLLGLIAALQKRIN
jgi:four helix bundle protein